MSYPFGPAERLDLHPRFADLRRDQPLARITMPYGGDAWLATRYADIRTVLADSRFSRAATVGADVPRLAPPIGDSNILSMDPPEHTRLRRLVGKAFTQGRVEQLRPQVQVIVDGLIDTMVASGPPGELVEGICWPLPITVICQLLGVPASDRGKFRQWVDQMLALGDDTTPESIGSAAGNLYEYMMALIATRRDEPADDLLSALVQARDSGDQLSEQELTSLGVVLLAAGHETTANQFGCHLYLLLSQREYWEQLVTDPDLVPRAVEECLRFAPLGTAGDDARIATEDLELGGQLVRAGEAVVVDFALGNRDGAAFPNPDVVDFNRKENAHIAFGHGVHHCLGAPLARLELKVAMATLVRRLPGLSLAVPADEVPWRSDRLVRGVRSLPVTW
jgi:cytochrome P450